MGVRVLPPSPGASFALKKALRQLEEDGSGRAKELRTLTAQVRRTTLPTVILSHELFSSASTGQSGRLLQCLDGREPHLVITLRDIARRLPSTWQQRVKGKVDIDYATFLKHIVERTGPGADFARHQDAVGVLKRWSVHFPPERVHVVTVPPSTKDRTLLPTRFGSVVGVDFTALDQGAARANESMDYVQTELVRRVNRLTSFESTRQSLWARRFLSGNVMAPRRGASLRTPDYLESWCREVADEQIAYIQKQGFAVHGDLDELVPGDDSFGPMPAEPDEAQLLEAAIPAVADLLMSASHHAEENRKLRRQLDRAGEAVGPRSARALRETARQLKRRASRSD